MSNKKAKVLGSHSEYRKIDVESSAADIIRRRVASVSNVRENLARTASGQGSFVLYTDGDRFLVMKRSKKVNNSGKWGLPGGRSDKGESPKQTAKRECKEEVGFGLLGKRISSHRVGNITIFVRKVKRPFKPNLNSEHTEYKWVSPRKLVRLSEGGKLHGPLRRLLESKPKIFRSAQVPGQNTWDYLRLEDNVEESEADRKLGKKITKEEAEGIDMPVIYETLPPVPEEKAKDLKEFTTLGEALIESRTVKSLCLMAYLPEVYRPHFERIQDVAQNEVFTDGTKLPLDPAEKAHVTILYLGDVEESKVGQICDVIRNTLASEKPCAMKPRGIGTFTPGKHSDGKHPVFMSYQESPSLHALHQKLREALQDYSSIENPFPKYTAHSTIGYLPRDITDDEKKRLSEVKGEKWPEWDMDKIVLVGNHYTPIEEFEIGSRTETREAMDGRNRVPISPSNQDSLDPDDHDWPQDRAESRRIQPHIAPDHTKVDVKPQKFEIESEPGRIENESNYVRYLTDPTEEEEVISGKDTWFPAPSTTVPYSPTLDVEPQHFEFVEEDKDSKRGFKMKDREYPIRERNTNIGDEDYNDLPSYSRNSSLDQVEFKYSRSSDKLGVNLIDKDTGKKISEMRILKVGDYTVGYGLKTKKSERRKGFGSAIVLEAMKTSSKMASGGHVIRDGSTKGPARLLYESLAKKGLVKITPGEWLDIQKEFVPGNDGKDGLVTILPKGKKVRVAEQTRPDPKTKEKSFTPRPFGNRGSGSGAPGNLQRNLKLENEEVISHEDQIPGGLADKRKPEDFDPEQLKKGIKVEMEHVDDMSLAREIAMDHLAEIPDYYSRLEKMEYEAENDGLNKVEKLPANFMNLASVKSEASRLQDRMEKKYPGLQLWITWNDRTKYLTLDNIKVPEDQRGKGVGGKVMRELVKFADKHGLAMDLTAGEENKARLKRWYKEFGFIPNKGRNKDYVTRHTMIRPVRKADVTAAAKKAMCPICKDVHGPDPKGSKGKKHQRLSFHANIKDIKEWIKTRKRLLGKGGGKHLFFSYVSLAEVITADGHPHQDPEGAQVGRQKQRSDPLPEAFREEMRAKGKRFRSPKTGNMIMFDSLPWTEQKKHYIRWKASHKGELFDAADDHEQMQMFKEKKQKADKLHKNKGERDPAPAKKVSEEAVPPKKEPAQKTKTGEPAATGRNLDEDAKDIFTEVSDQVGLFDDQKGDVQEEVFKKPAKEVHKWAQQFKQDKQFHGIVHATLRFLKNLGMHDHKHMKRWVQKAVDSLKGAGKSLKEMGKKELDKARTKDIFEEFQEARKKKGSLSDALLASPAFTEEELDEILADCCCEEIEETDAEAIFEGDGPDIDGPGPLKRKNRRKIKGPISDLSDRDEQAGSGSRWKRTKTSPLQEGYRK